MSIMSEVKRFSIENYNHSFDFHERIDLLREENLYNPERDNDMYLKSLTERRPEAIKVAREIGKISCRMLGSIYIGDGIGVVGGLVVAKDARRCGIGGALLDAAEDVLIAEGHRQFEIQIDDGQDELAEWYCKRGFKPRYFAVGLMKPLRIPDRHIIYEDQQQLTRERVNKAFITLYSGKRLSHKLKGLPTGEDSFTFNTIGLSQLFKTSSIPALRNAFFLEERLTCKLTTSPWQAYATEKSPQEEDHFIAWIRRFSEYFIYGEKSTKGEVPEKIANDTFLFLRILEDRREYGRLRNVGELDIEGDYVCYDQANNYVFPFSIEPNQGIVRMSDEKAAIMLERMVACAEALQLTARGQETYVVRNNSSNN